MIFLAQIGTEQVDAVNRLLVEVDTMKLLVGLMILIAVIMGIVFYFSGRSANSNADAIQSATKGGVVAQETTQQALGQIGKATESINSLESVTSANTRQLTELTTTYGALVESISKLTGNIAEQTRLETVRQETLLNAIGGAVDHMKLFRDFYTQRDENAVMLIKQVNDSVNRLIQRPTLTNADLQPLINLLTAISNRVHMEVRTGSPSITANPVTQTNESQLVQTEESE